MPSYIMLTRLTPEGAKTMAQHPDRVRTVNAELEDFDCRLVAQYATLGEYDFVNIVEAPNNETIAVLSAALQSRGSLAIVTLPVISVGDLLGHLKAKNLG